MPRTRTENLNLIKIIGIIISTILVITFVIAKSLNYAKGPEIDILSPENAHITSSSTIKVSGKALRINKITLNGDPISIDESGNWISDIVVFEGINKITIKAEDKFGRIVEKKLDIVGKTNQ